jgi:hypothetical protein
MDHTALYPSRWYSSWPSLWDPQILQKFCFPNLKIWNPSEPERLQKYDELVTICIYITQYDSVH